MERNRRPRKPGPRKAGSRTRAGRRPWWRWLGWGALGLAGAVLLRRSPRLPGPRRPVREPSDRGPSVAEPPLDLPPQTAVSWIPGPGGSLRIAEVHPSASKAVIFVHGLAGRLEHWAPLLATLGPAIRGIAVDLPGHGESDGDAGGEAGISSLAAAVGAVIEDLSLRRPLLVAHSVGALAAVDYAGHHPGRIAGLLLVDSSGDQSALPEADRERFLEALRRDPAGELEWNFRQFLAGSRPEVADRVLEGARELPPEVVVGILDSASRYRPLDALDRYGGPVRAVASEHNDLPSSLHRRRPDIPCRRLAGAGHWLMLDRPQEVWEELVELLEEVYAL